MADSWLAGVCHEVFKKNAEPTRSRKAVHELAGFDPTHGEAVETARDAELVQTDVLIVDEISMMSVPLERRRCCPPWRAALLAPFGGLTVLFLGDLHRSLS